MTITAADSGDDDSAHAGVENDRHGAALTVGRPDGPTAALVTILVLTVGPLGGPAAAQSVAPNRSATYLFPTDVRDARAIWVNPAASAWRGKHRCMRNWESAIGCTGAAAPDKRRVHSRGLSLGYQRDFLDNGVRGTTLRLGLAGGTQGLAAGFDIARYSGNG